MSAYRGAAIKCTYCGYEYVIKHHKGYTTMKFYVDSCDMCLERGV